MSGSLWLDLMCYVRVLSGTSEAPGIAHNTVSMQLCTWGRAHMHFSAEQDGGLRRKVSHAGWSLKPESASHGFPQS